MFPEFPNATPATGHPAFRKAPALGRPVNRCWGMAKIRVGISGWRYTPWRGVFYPSDLPQRLELHYASRVLPTIELLRDHNIALVIAETAKRWPMMQDITADFVYMRLHGDKELYKSGYSDRALDRWARRVAAWHRGSEPRDAQKASKLKPPTSKPRDIYCYFDNTDVKLRAPVDAQSLMRKLKLR